MEAMEPLPWNSKNKKTTTRHRPICSYLQAYSKTISISIYGYFAELGYIYCRYFTRLGHCEVVDQLLKISLYNDITFNAYQDQMTEFLLSWCLIGLACANTLPGQTPIGLNASDYMASSTA